MITSPTSTTGYILPTPVQRSRPAPPLARPPSIHHANEDRKSVVHPPTSHLPSIPSEPEQQQQPVVDHAIQPAIEEHEESATEDKEGPVVAETPQEHEEAGHENEAPPPPSETAPTVTTQVEDHVQEHQEHAKEDVVVAAQPVAQEEPVVAVADTPAPSDKAEEHVPESQEAPQEPAAAVTDAAAAADAAATEETAEKEEEAPVVDEKPKLPEMESSGPALNHAARPRPAKGRKLPSVPVPSADSSFASQLEAGIKDDPTPPPAVEKASSPPPSAPAPVVAQRPASIVDKAAPPPPPPKPVKPIFQKFPTPFAGAAPGAVSLRPTGRRIGSSHDTPQSPSSESAPSGISTTSSSAASSGPATTTPAVGGVKSLSSRFGQGAPGAGGANTAVLELEIAKLRRYINEELDRVKQELAEERESRQKLQEEVNQLKAQLNG